MRISESIVLRMLDRREDEVVRGRRGKSVRRSLELQIRLDSVKNTKSGLTRWAL